MDTTVNTNIPRYSTFILNHEWHSKVIGVLVGVLMLSIYLWLVGGITNLLRDLFSFAISDWTHGAETMIKDVVIMLAALELIRTLQSYLAVGRVKVTFILDAALVVLIGELISLWYGEYTTSQVIVNISVITVLTILRIITTKYSPDSSDETGLSQI